MVTNKSFLIAGRELQQLKREARESQQLAYAEGTFSNFSTQWVTFMEFCIKFSLVAFPVTSMTLVWYVQYLSSKLRSHRTLNSYLSGSKKLHELLGFSTKGYDGVLLKLTLQGLRRSNQHIVRRAPPVTPTILKKVYYRLNHNDADDVVFWAVCVVAFFLLFRKSNLLPDTKNGFNSAKQLRHKDCLLVNGKMVVGIRWAKNEQFKRQLLTFPLPKLNSILCPVKAIMNMRKVVPHAETDHIFKLTDGNSLTYRAFQNRFRQILKLAEVPNATSYCSHGFRRGGTTFCFLSGIPTEVIRVLGNWRSNCFLTYIEFPLETRTAASELMQLRIEAMEKRGL